MKVAPVQDFVTIKVINTDPFFAGGQLMLPEDAVAKSQQGIIQSVGPGKYSEKGFLIPMQLKEGDHILFAKYSGTELTVDNESIVLLRESDVLAKFVKE